MPSAVFVCEAVQDHGNAGISNSIRFNIFKATFHFILFIYFAEFFFLLSCRNTQSNEIGSTGRNRNVSHVYMFTQTVAPVVCVLGICTVRCVRFEHGEMLSLF